MENQIDQRFLEQQNNNIQQQDEHEVYKYMQSTQIFEMGKEHFKQCHQALAIYTVLKFITALTLIIVRETVYREEQLIKNYSEIFDDAYLEIWIYFSLVHSFLASIYYIELLLFIDQTENSNKIVEQTGHLIEIYVPLSFSQMEREAYIAEQIELSNQEMMQRLEIDGQMEESRKVNLIAQDIKKKILQNKLSINIAQKGCFTIFQIIQLWGLIYYFSVQSNNNVNYEMQFYSLYRGYLFMVVFFGIYQYLEIYIMTLIILIFLPILLFYSIYDWIKSTCRKRREKRRIDESLKESMFSLQETQDEDNECAICMTSYEEKDKIAVLPCSNKHKFHSACVRSWLIVNSKCPLCRSDIFGEPEQI